MTLLRPIKRNFIQPNLIIYDVETKTNESGILEFHFAIVKRLFQKELMEMICYTKEHLTNTILRYCVSNPRLNIIFAHNCEFDFSFIDFTIFQLNYDLVNLNTNPFFALYKAKDRKVLFLDTMNFFKTSLKELGKIFGIEKLEFDFNDFDNLEDFIVYCKRDMEILELIVKQIIEMHETYNIPFSWTFPQIAYRIFRKHYLKQNLIIPDNINIKELERKSYCGGRVEVFDFNYFDKINVYDFNSLYPSVMLNNLYPTEVIEYYSYDNCKIYETKVLIQKIINEQLNNNLCIAQVIVDIPLCHIPPIPVKYDNKLLFPCGQFETVLCSPELELIIDNILEIKQLIIYKGNNIFDEFILDFYDKRLQAKALNNKIYDQIYKLIMNSLYGKFAQRKFIDIRHYGLDNHFENNTCEMDNHYIKWIEGKAYEKIIDVINPNSFTAIASFVTSYARRKLYEELLNCDYPIYCDTDSIFTPHKILNTDDKKLGGLKYEHDYRNFQALGNKMYMWLEDYKIKGLPKKNFVNGKKITIEISEHLIKSQYTKLSKLQETIKRFHSTDLRILDTTKDFKLIYNKRIIQQDNKTIPQILVSSKEFQPLSNSKIQISQSIELYPYVLNIY